LESAQLPPDEDARLSALEAFDILDTLPEPAFDDITRIASQICDTPIALVSLVDHQRQWFKSRFGIDATETPRHLAFCAHAILEPDDLFVVEDATTDSRFSDNPLVASEPHVRFYAGAPLVTSRGHVLGTLCVIDKTPRKLNPEQQESLRALSRQVIAQLELRMTIKELESHRRALQVSHDTIEASRDDLANLCDTLECQADIIERDLHRAEIIQHSLLPEEPPSLSDYHVQALYRCGHIVGGDLYDVQLIGDQHLALVIADAAGHGVSAAMLAVLFKHRLRLQHHGTAEPYSPAEALQRMNTALMTDLKVPGAFVTAAVGLLNVQTGELCLASAGHTPVVVFNAAGGTHELRHTGPALGLYDDAVFEEHCWQVHTGDQVLMMTDGIHDLGGDTPPTTAELDRALRKYQGNSDSLRRTFFDVARGQERQERDDATLLLLVAGEGNSHFIEIAESDVIKKVVQESPAAITWAQTDVAHVICLSGRVTWVLGEALLKAATDILQAGHALLIDLQECEYLDSTMLGTLHEVVVRYDKATKPVEIQAVSAALVEAFEELSMKKVLSHRCATDKPKTSERQLVAIPVTNVQRSQQRLLKAHEMLASLGDANKEKFADVIDAIKQDAD
jgi:serine phosphatase RsbU (regulator of sigma subunit)/ABC-type transporter Mla MlaB component